MQFSQSTKNSEKQKFHVTASPSAVIFRSPQLSACPSFPPTPRSAPQSPRMLCHAHGLNINPGHYYVLWSIQSSTTSPSLWLTLEGNKETASNTLQTNNQVWIWFQDITLYFRSVFFAREMCHGYFVDSLNLFLDACMWKYDNIWYYCHISTEVPWFKLAALSLPSAISTTEYDWDRQLHRLWEGFSYRE